MEPIRIVPDIMADMSRRRIRSFGSKPTLWPSQASVVINGEVEGKCMRSAYYEKTNVPRTEEVDDAVKLMGYMGVQIEDGLIDICKNLGMWEANNVKWQKNGLSGEVDVVLSRTVINEQGEPEEVKFVVECKSCSGYYINKEVYGYFEGRGGNRRYVKGKPKLKHYLQSIIYADISRPTCVGSLIIYFSRDESKMTEFWIEVKEDGSIYLDGELEPRFKMQDIYSRYETLQGFIDKGETPPREYKSVYTVEEVEALFELKLISKSARDKHIKGDVMHMDAECKYCSHRTHCQNDTDNGDEAVTEEIPPDYFIMGSM